MIEGWCMGSAEVLRCGEDDWDGLRASIITAMEREQRGQHVKEELDVSDTDSDINEVTNPVKLLRFLTSWSVSGPSLSTDNCAIDVPGAMVRRWATI